MILGVILRAIYEILMIEMVVGDDSYEKSCWKWSRNHCGTTDRSMVILGEILRVIFRVVYDSYDGNGSGR